MSPDILVLYGTTDGQTAKIAAAIASTLRMEGAQVHLVNAARPGPDPRPEDYAGVIVAASVHAGGYQKAARRWVGARASLSPIPSSFVSVCLGVLNTSGDRSGAGENRAAVLHPHSLAAVQPQDRGRRTALCALQLVAVDAAGLRQTSFRCRHRDYEYAD
jgi:flavodoxin